MLTYKVEVEDNGTKSWYLNGQLHREDGPAVERVGGDKYWCLNGQRHRKDGPAVEYANGSKYWYLNGQELTETEFLKKTTKVKEMTVKEISDLLGFKIKIIK